MTSTEAKNLLGVTKEFKGMLDKMRSSLRRLCFQQGRVTVNYVLAIGLSLVVGSAGIIVLQNKYPEILPDQIGEMRVK